MGGVGVWAPLRLILVRITDTGGQEPPRQRFPGRVPRATEQLPAGARYCQARSLSSSVLYAHSVQRDVKVLAGYSELSLQIIYVISAIACREGIHVCKDSPPGDLATGPEIKRRLP
jgi:hypothetical protein